MKKEILEEKKQRKNAQSLAWYYAHKSDPKFLEYTREKAKKHYYSFSEEQKEIHNKKNKEYKELNKEKFAGYERKRRALKKNSDHSTYTVDEVLLKYGTSCYICNIEIDLNASRRTGKKDWKIGLQIDHMKSIANGGSDTIDNVRPTHGLCNAKKNKSDFLEEVI